MMLRYVPTVYKNVGKFKDLYKHSPQINYFPDYFSNQMRIIKLMIIFSQICFITMIIILTKLIKQRISVPELVSEKGKNYIISASSILSVICLLGLTFYNEKFLKFSRNSLGISDNILFLIYITNTYIFCSLTYNILLKIQIYGIPHDEFYMSIKRYTLMAMGISLIIYFVSLVLISYYTPVIHLEKLLMGFIIICKELNSIIFIFNFLVFVLTMKFDLYYIFLNLQIRPDVEFFLDQEESISIDTY